MHVMKLDNTDVTLLRSKPRRCTQDLHAYHPRTIRKTFFAVYGKFTTLRNEI